MQKFSFLIPCYNCEKFILSNGFKLLKKIKNNNINFEVFFLNDGSATRIQCYDWTKKMGYTDHLKITLDHPEYIDWMENKL